MDRATTVHQKSRAGQVSTTNIIFFLCEATSILLQLGNLSYHDAQGHNDLWDDADTDANADGGGVITQTHVAQGHTDVPWPELCEHPRWYMKETSNKYPSHPP